MEKSPSNKRISENKKAEISIITEDSSFFPFTAEILTTQRVPAVLFLWGFYKDFLLLLTFQPFRDIINTVN